MVHSYRRELSQNRFNKHTRAQAWNAVLELFKREVRGERTNFAEDSDIEESPKLRKKQIKRKRKTKKRGSKVLGVLLAF